MLLELIEYTPNLLLISKKKVTPFEEYCFIFLDTSEIFLK